MLFLVFVVVSPVKGIHTLTRNGCARVHTQIIIDNLEHVLEYELMM